MRISILFFMTAFALLAGCKKEEEEEIKMDEAQLYEESVKAAYSYPITFTVDSLDCSLWVNYKINGEDYNFMIERAIDYNGTAADFILQYGGYHFRVKESTREGWMNIVRKKTNENGESIYFDVIDVLNQDVPYFYYIAKIFKD